VNKWRKRWRRQEQKKKTRSVVQRRNKKNYLPANRTDTIDAETGVLGKCASLERVQSQVWVLKDLGPLDTDSRMEEEETGHMSRELMHAFAKWGSLADRLTDRQSDRERERETPYRAPLMVFMRWRRREW